MTNVVDTLIEAAADAIRNQTPAITSEVGRLKSITLELEISHGNRVADSTCWVERRGVHQRKERPA